MYQEIVPTTLEDTILSYLKDQEVFGEQYTDYNYEIEETTAEEEVKDVLEDLLLRVNKRIACRDRYENLKQWHHQYPLFDLSHYVPNFCIDDEMLRKLSFRESLLISEVDSASASAEVEPRPVGGLCLDVQVVEGHQPTNKELLSEAEMDREIFQILQRIKTDTERKSARKDGKIEEEVQRKLREYETFLRNETRSNVKKFLVHFSSQLDVDGCNAGSAITAWVDRHLHTLEEKRDEFMRRPGGLDEKTVYVGLQSQKYYARHTSSLDNLDVRRYYPFNVTKNLMMEGATFLFMRYLAMTKFVGTVELSTMYITGEMCRNIYECLGPKPGEVNGKTIEVCKIYRYVIEESGIEHLGVTVLTTHGRIVTQEWEGCSYILNMNPLQYVDRNAPASYQRLVLSKTWQDDMQLMSKYLDCKTEAEREMKTYLVDHPEVKEIIADYVQNVLLLKPENIMAFTQNYFQNLCPFDTARVPYTEQDEDRPTDEIEY